LLPHIQDINNNQVLKNADVICFTETWLERDATPAGLFSAHKFYATHISEAYDQHWLAGTHRGGVAMFVHNKHLQRHFPILTSHLEVVAVVVNNVLLVTLYRPPSYRMQFFIERLNLLLQEIHNHSMPSVIVGDFNADVLKECENTIVQKFAEFGFKQLVRFPTTEGGTCLDLVFVHGLDMDISPSLVHTYYRYHDAVKVSWRAD
jgi:exonuclease III